MAKPQPVIVAEPELVLKKGQRFFLENVDLPKDKDGVPVPSFSSTEVAKMFFGKNSGWMQWRMRKSDDHPQGFFILDGEPMEFNFFNGQRRFSLYDIERMAHALAQGGHLPPGDLSKTIHLVRYCAQLHGIL